MAQVRHPPGTRGTVRSPRTLSAQIILPLFLILLVVLLSLGAFQYLALRRYLQGRTADSLRAQIHTALSGANAHTDPTDIARALNSPGTAVAIYDTNGHLQVTGGPPGGNPAGRAPDTARRPDLPDLSLRRVPPQGEVIHSGDGAPWLLVAEPIGPRRSPGGTVFLASRIDDLQATLATQATLAGLGSIAGLLVAMAFAWYFIRRALRPLNQLAGTARSIAGGDWQQRAAGGGAAEVEQVATAFNQMVGTIQESLTQERATVERMRRFVADAAHELRTPVTALSGFVELMQGGAVTNPEQQALALDSMARETRRLSRLVSDLLRLARLDAAPKLELARLDLAELLQSLLPALIMAAGEHPIALDAPVPTPIMGNADGLTQIVWNLVDNACKYSPTNAPVRISCTAAGGEAVLAVEDEGKGIPAAELGHVFERFWRGDKSRSRIAGGSGLGLAIVASLVKAHGGHVALSPRVGGGTRAEVRLPLAED